MNGWIALGISFLSGLTMVWLAIYSIVATPTKHSKRAVRIIGLILVLAGGLSYFFWPPVDEISQKFEPVLRTLGI